MTQNASTALTSVTPGEIKRLFDYVSTHSLVPAAGHFQPADAILVCSRLSRGPAEAAVRMFRRNLALIAAFTGGVGKDAGHILTVSGTPEAVFQAAIAERGGIPGDRIVIEPHARNGADNARLGYEAVRNRLGRPPRSIIFVAWATSVRRLTEQLLTIARVDGWPELDVQVCPTDHLLSSGDLVDVAEAAAEALRLVEWPDKRNTDGSPWLLPQEVPAGVADTAYRIKAELGL